MNANFRFVSLMLGLLGAAAGGVAGYYGFMWILSQGLYAMMLPGAAVGLGFSLLARDRSIVYGIVCAVLGIGLGLYTEWRIAPLGDDASLSYFLTHFYDVLPISLVMIALGGVFGYWFGVGRTPHARGAQE